MITYTVIGTKLLKKICYIHCFISIDFRLLLRNELSAMTISFEINITDIFTTCFLKMATQSPGCPLSLLLLFFQTYLWYLCRVKQKRKSALVCGILLILVVHNGKMVVNFRARQGQTGTIMNNTYSEIHFKNNPAYILWPIYWFCL